MLKQHLVKIIEEDEKARNKIYYFKCHRILVKLKQPSIGRRQKTNQ